ncbi:MAG: DUF885 domain-containing protein [Anaerolineae bacterium]|jgi:uncharacterized protein (DUF885 family)|nr:DUF885 domain-containing protein [Anaerolineae bacterium]
MKKIPIVYLLLAVALWITAILAGCASDPAPSIETELPDFMGEVEPAEIVETAVPVESDAPVDASTTQEVGEEPESISVPTGLPIHEFFEVGYNELLKLNPEYIVELGLQEYFPTDELLTNISPEAEEQRAALQQALLDILHTYDYESLTPSEQISYQVMEWDLETSLQAFKLRRFDYPVTYFTVRSIPQLSIMFFTDTLQVNSLEEAELYLQRLEALGPKMEQAADLVQENADAGIIPPADVLYGARTDIKNNLGSTAVNSPLYKVFKAHLGDLDITDAQEEELLAEAKAILNDSVYPAFEALDALLGELLKDAPAGVGLSQYDGGEEYYQFVLKTFTTTSLTPEEIHTCGKVELARIQEEMRQRFAELGYDDDISIIDAYSLVAQESGTLNGEAIAQEYEAILQHANENLDEYFDIRPQASLEVVGGTMGAFYSPGSLDGTRPGQFYARITNPEPIYKMASLAYHEGIPGHHFQIALAQESDLPGFRNSIIFDGYTEGWALYAEYIAAEMGWYVDDPYGDLGRLQYEALRAARMVADTGIHRYGWTQAEASAFLQENTGLTKGYCDYEAWRYIAYPGQATAYLVGKIEILRLREEAMQTLGDDFDIKEFHRIVLENGSVPLMVLEEIIDHWLEEN